MRTLILASAAISMFAVAATAQAHGYWPAYCCAGYEGLHAPPSAIVYESWPTEAYYGPVAPQPWYGSMTVAEQARVFAARRAEVEREQNDSAGE